ncbi:hypothetical protein RN001_006944 [Aquatica leii]|uniref:Gamma-interferon-inducible lysosomal thiol reductase n=1 Tax=Aquatica leii TaxID=1421715 RepID=A0AAN7Q981_9COLE|nr:hypothetical protein RN001_006944 [Aquatica leii]
MNFSGLFVLVILQSVCVLADNKLKVSIYYEVLCPDSYQFLTQQFCPVYKKIGSSLNVHLVPYGRATHKFIDNEWIFTCQHGPDECWGNKIQACGINEVEEQDAKIEFMCCIMNNYQQAATTTQLNYCVHHLNTTSKSVLNCTGSSLGTNLLVSYGNETHALNHLSFIPTIIFNDNLTQSLDIQSSILHNFYDTTVKYLNDTSETNNSFLVSSRLSVTLLPTLLLFTYQFLMH